MAEKKVKEPLFYIQQPSFQFPETSMQTVYSSRKAELDRKQDQKDSVPEPADNITELTMPEEKIEKMTEVKVQETIEEFEAGREENNESASFAFTTEKRKPAFKRVKSFKEMDTLERLDYLIDFPKQLPPIPCIFETGEKAIRGFLISRNEEWIEIKLFDDTIEQLNLQSLNAVKMIGLRR